MRRLGFAAQRPPRHDLGAAPPDRSTGRRLRPILLGLIAAVPACLIVYALVALAVFALAPH